MLLTILLVFAFLIGCVCGLRSMTGPALLSWAAHLGWMQLDGTKLAFLHNPISLVVFTLLALGELVADKLPFIPSRIRPGPLAVRFVLGAACGMPFSVQGGKAWLLCGLAGGIGGLAVAFAGYHVRRWLTVGRGLPDFPVALVEDVVAVALGLFLVSPMQFSGPL